MPSPSTPRRTSKRQGDKTPLSKPKVIDVGVPLGVYDTNSVRERVRIWQDQGGGVITASDIYVEDHDEGNEKSFSNRKLKEQDSRKPSAPNRKDIRHEDRTSERTKGGREAKAGDGSRDRTRSRSAPAKRVVSDAHWRKNRSPPRDTASPKSVQHKPKAKIQPDDGIRVKPISDGQSGNVPKAQNDKRSSRKESVGGDDGIRVYATPPSSRRQSRNMEKTQGGYDLSPAERNSDGEVASSRSPHSRDAETKKRSRHQRSEESGGLEPSPSKVHSSRRRSVHQREKITIDAERSSAPIGFSEGRGSTKSQRGNILSQVFGDTRNIFSKQHPLPTSAPRVPSVEAWLKETSDPFTDEIEPPLDAVTPLRSSSPAANEDTPIRPVDDPNKIWDLLGQSVPITVSHGSKRRKRTGNATIYEDLPPPTAFDSELPLGASPPGARSASKLCDLVGDPPPSSPSSLRRRGAQKSSGSPSKVRPKPQLREEIIAENDNQSVLSSVDTASSVEPSDPKSPLRPPGLTFKRPFPSTGQHRLSTIASVETFDTRRQSVAPSLISKTSATTVPQPPDFQDSAIEEARDIFDPDSLKRSKSYLTKHADLISILSLPKAGNKSIQSARSIRTNRSRLATATIGDLMKELAMDETKYMRELRTLVDGVIPVLLTCVLSKSDSAVAADLFRPSANVSDDPNFTKPVIDMGIALERLKSLHKRIPTESANALLSWAQRAQRVYADYLKAWRMGFQDVVVNLAPAEPDGGQEANSPLPNQDGLEGGLSRNKDGDVVDGDGERVDVAFLLKRPLVRLKYLAKTLKGINFLTPSTEAEKLANEFQNLVIDARKRSNEERARLEDEAATNIDVTRARDPRTLAPVTGVSIDKTRRVRARDHCNLVLQHSSGQRVDCRVEMLLRDETSGVGSGGDLLICEVDSTGRWLLFPPTQLGHVSARNGDLKAEIVVMLRGLSSNGSEWQELLSLRTDDEQVGFEWVQMLGLIPIPPRISRSHSFLNKRPKSEPRSETGLSALEPPLGPSVTGKSRTPSPREMEVPIGEKTSSASKRWSEVIPAEEPMEPSNADLSREKARLQKKAPSTAPVTPTKTPQTYLDNVHDLRSLPSPRSETRTRLSKQSQTVRDVKESAESPSSTSPSSLRRSLAKRISRHGGGSPVSANPTERIESGDGEQDAMKPHFDVEEASSNRRNSSPTLDDLRSLSPEPRPSPSLSGRKGIAEPKTGSPRPSLDRSRSSVPLMEIPAIPKVRKDSLPTTPISEPEEEEIEWVVPATTTDSFTSPKKLTKQRPTSLKSASEHVLPPPPPQHSPLKLNGSKTPVLNASAIQNPKRRSSSPLKHEYEPSISSVSSSDSETLTVEHNEVSSISDSSDDDDEDEDELEAELVSTPLLPLGTFHSSSKRSAPPSLYSLPNDTLSPSQSASQAPYKTVPPQPTKASKTIASIFSWSDRGAWESLHPEECSIVITPGLIEAYKMSAAHSAIIPPRSSCPVTDADVFSEQSSNLADPSKEAEGERPLVALELTPLVPLRRGTALDISIRSPPTSKSQITTGDNVMFRSRNPEECEALYALINHSRIHNPTYVALQNARGPYGPGSTFGPGLDRRNSSRVGSQSSSWFGGLGRSPSYRANSAPTPSIAQSESSIGSMTSKWSALVRYGKGGIFNIARSTISSRYGSGANSVYTGSDNSSGSGTNSPNPLANGVGGGPGKPPGAIGLTNAKIRLYVRETASKWRDLGSARLSILPPTISPLPSPDGSGGSERMMRRAANEKRIVINGKTKGEVLLDVQLGEQCFERTARTGIAVNVYEDVVGPNGEVGVVGAIGGVGGGRSRVYMIQVWMHSPSLAFLCSLFFKKKLNYKYIMSWF